MKRLIVDANILIRFLRADHPDHFEKVKRLFEKVEQGELRLVLLPAVMAEVVFVLSSFYECNRKEIAEALHPFLFHGGIECPESKILEDTLKRYASTNIDFMDCYVAATSLQTQTAVCSFDKDFRRFKDVDWVIPE